MEDLIYGYLNQKMEKSNKLTFFFFKVYNTVCNNSNVIYYFLYQ